MVLWQGAMGRPLSFRVNCPLIGTLREVSGEGYHVFSVCPLVYSEKGPRGRLVLLTLCSVSPSVLKAAPGEDSFVLM